ncbi:hypothetical protein NPIL_558341 [Nephila pilipes]|uniref:Uncharacterized protein n=1 Tax=Nephila pilipes TaxID=299642 RepID=A0A8X6QY79_NEPPI|nr:hypothetical protein NPIL_558341 [Nephila pilipes]
MEHQFDSELMISGSLLLVVLLNMMALVDDDDARDIDKMVRCSWQLFTFLNGTENPKNCGTFNDRVQIRSFVMEQYYKGERPVSMLSNFCWGIQRYTLEVPQKLRTK